MTKTYTASRLTSGNLLFRDKIIVDLTAEKVTYWKRNPFGIGHEEITINFTDISCVNVKTNMQYFFFSNISIETRGGNEILANGFYEGDAKEIKKLIGF